MSTLFLPSVTLNVGSALRIIDDMCLLIRQRVNCMWFNKYMVIYVTSIDINIIIRLLLFKTIPDIPNINNPIPTVKYS